MTGSHERGYKKTIPRPKNWAHVSRSEGRSGKSGRTKKVKLKEEAWRLHQLQGQLRDIKAGLHECNWMITCANPARVLTPSDFLRIQYRKGDDWPEEYVEVHSNFKHRVLHIEELDFLPKGLPDDGH